MTLTLLSNLLVAALLLATIGYAAVLNRRLGALRGDKAKLQELIHALTAATTSAHAGIANLRETVDELGVEVDKKMAASRSLKDDLAYLIERATQTADRIEGTIRAKREEPEPPRASEAEHERIPAGIRPKAAPTAQRPAPVPKVTLLKSESDEAPVLPAALRGSGGVSRSERDLLRALGGRR
jgi:chromosome segregation ATPase